MLRPLDGLHQRSWQLITLRLGVNAQVVRFDYITLKVASHFAAKLIDNGARQSLVSDKPRGGGHRFVRWE